MSIGEFEGKVLVDVVVFGFAAAFSLAGIAYVAILWSLRRNFFIVMRSPRLVCVLALSSTLDYITLVYLFTIISIEETENQADIALLVSGPALLTGEVALIMIAVRLLVMYYPSERARWGRFAREIPLAYGLVVLFTSMEIAVWTAAWSLDINSVADVVGILQLGSGAVTVLVVFGLGGRLKKVNDAGNMSHDIRVVGALMLGTLCLQIFFIVFMVPFVMWTYLEIALISIPHTSIIWICVIRPVREVVHNIPRPRRSTVEALLVSPHRRASGSSVAIASTDLERTASRKGFQACDANRLSSIMSFLPLREAFGEFCRKSLCSESFEFLLDVLEFQEDIEDAAAVDDKTNKGFSGYLAIVNGYIIDGSHSEINIESRTKLEITKHATFEDYALLDLDGRKEIFSTATNEIRKILVENLLNKFLLSAEYKTVVHT